MLSFRARTRWRRLGIVVSAGGAGFAKRVQGLTGRCRGILQSRGGVLKKLKAGRNPKDGGWLSEPV